MTLITGELHTKDGSSRGEKNLKTFLPAAPIDKVNTSASSKGACLANKFLAKGGGTLPPQHVHIPRGAGQMET